MFTVYVIKNEFGKIYIGQTNNKARRLKQHNDVNFDKRSYTKINKGHWNLIYEETFITRKDAMKREKELKSSRGRNFIRTKILS